MDDEVSRQAKAAFEHLVQMFGELSEYLPVARTAIMAAYVRAANDRVLRLECAKERSVAQHQAERLREELISCQEATQALQDEVNQLSVSISSARAQGRADALLEWQRELDPIFAQRR